MQNQQPQPVVWEVCVRRVRGIGLSTLNSQVSTKNHNNIVTNIPPDLRLKFIANTQ